MAIFAFRKCGDSRGTSPSRLSAKSALPCVTRCLQCAMTSRTASGVLSKICIPSWMSPSARAPSPSFDSVSAHITYTEAFSAGASPAARPPASRALKPGSAMSRSHAATTSAYSRSAAWTCARTSVYCGSSRTAKSCDTAFSIAWRADLGFPWCRKICARRSRQSGSVGLRRRHSCALRWAAFMSPSRYELRAAKSFACLMHGAYRATGWRTWLTFFSSGIGGSVAPRGTDPHWSSRMPTTSSSTLGLSSARKPAPILSALSLAPRSASASSRASSTVSWSWPRLIMRMMSRKDAVDDLPKVTPISFRNSSWSAARSRSPVRSRQWMTPSIDAVLTSIEMLPAFSYIAAASSRCPRTCWMYAHVTR